MKQQQKSRTVRLGSLSLIVGFLAFVELTSGVLQGYYTPMLTNIARHLHITDAEVNWFEGTQLMFSALVVPAFAKLGDLYGHKKLLLTSTALTAAASLALPFTDTFATFIIAWTLQGFYVVWLPMEIAIIWARSRNLPGATGITTKAAGVLVAFLQIGAICGALTGGALVDMLPLQTVLLIPGIMVALCFVVIAFGVSEPVTPPGGRIDSVGLVLISLALITITGGLSLLRLQGYGSAAPWLTVLAGLALCAVFARYELRHPEPLIDVRMFRSPALSPVFITAGLFGISLLGAQAPLSTFARTDPEVTGYGLGTTGFATSLLIGLYLIAMTSGALLFSKAARALTPRTALITACSLVGLGFALFLPLHHSYTQVVINMLVVGLGSGALVAALPALAAAAAPVTQTGVATGLTNSIKTVGGAVGSAIFGLALLQGTAGTAGATAGSYAGYLTVWTVCAVTAFAAVIALLLIPKTAFSVTADAAPQSA